MASEEKKGEKKFLNERGLARLVCLVSAQVNCFESPSVRASLVLLINLFLPPCPYSPFISLPGLSEQKREWCCGRCERVKIEREREREKSSSQSFRRF